MKMDRCYPRSQLRKWSIFSYIDEELFSQIKMAYVFGGGNAIMVTKDDEVFSIGSNKLGCLGIGNECFTFTATKVTELCKKGVKGIADGSGGNVVAYTESGAVYSWGNSRFAKSQGQENTTRLIPTAVSANICGTKVVDVACGSDHVLFLTQNGEVYSSGMIEGRYPATNKLYFINKVTAIACGTNSCMAITENGKLYAWGVGHLGELGTGQTGYQEAPLEVAGLSGVVIRKVVCGFNHTMALSDVGTLYTWGSNTEGQLGYNGPKALTPTTLTLGSHRVVDIAATNSDWMSAAMTENGKVYIWGSCGGMKIKTPVESNLVSLVDAFATYSPSKVTGKPIYIDCDGEPTTAEIWRNAFDDPTNSDLTIKVGGKPIHVHKCFLKIRCQHFRSMFQGHWKEDTADELEMNQFSYAAYRSFLQYLYTDELHVTYEYVMELFDLAKSYCEIRLQQECQQMVTTGITVENAAILYTTLSHYNVKELEQFLLKFCNQNLMAILKTEGFNGLDPEVGMHLVHKSMAFNAEK